VAMSLNVGQEFTWRLHASKTVVTLPSEVGSSMTKNTQNKGLPNYEGLSNVH